MEPSWNDRQAIGLIEVLKIHGDGDYILRWSIAHLGASNEIAFHAPGLVDTSPRGACALSTVPLVRRPEATPQRRLAHLFL